METISPRPVSRDPSWQPVALAALVAGLLEWLPWIGPLAYPFRLLTTSVHELCHGLAALATGGRFLRYVVFSDGSGLAYTGGGWRLLVIPAGYLGVTAFAAALLLLGRTVKGGRYTLVVLGVLTAVLSVRYSVPTVLSTDILAGLLTLGAGLGFGIVLLWVGLRATGAGAAFALPLVAFEAALSAFADLATLVGLSSQSAQVQTDAHSMAELAWLPPVVWAVLWAGISLAVTAWAMSVRWARP